MIAVDIIIVVFFSLCPKLHALFGREGSLGGGYVWGEQLDGAYVHASP